MSGTFFRIQEKRKGTPRSYRATACYPFVTYKGQDESLMSRHGRQAKKKVKRAYKGRSQEIGKNRGRQAAVRPYIINMFFPPF